MKTKEENTVARKSYSFSVRCVNLYKKENINKEQQH